MDLLQPNTPAPVLVHPEADQIYTTHYDTLNGKRLHAGESVRVTWPDGSSTEEVIVIDRRSPPFNYGGPIYQAPDDRAFIEVPHLGATLRVYLRWEPAILLQRIPMPEPPPQPA